MREELMAGVVKVERIHPENNGRSRRTQLDVVFIHGLGGDSKDTWSASSTEYWPQRVADANPHTQVWVVEYPAKPGQLLTLGEMDQPGTAGLSVLITEKLRTKKIGERPCVFVCHSLGGLVTKRILLDAWGVSKSDKTRFKHENIKAVMFCGTPHRGSAIASVLKGAEWVKGVALRNLLPYVGWPGDKVGEKVGELAANSVMTTSALITELEKNNVGLQHLNEDFRDYYGKHVHDGFMVKVYAETEKLKVKGVPTAMVVSAESANPNLRIGPNPPLQVLPVPGKDHSELVKPTREDDYVVEGLNDLICRVKAGNYNFDLHEEVQQKVAMLLHAELRRWDGLVDLHCFSALRTEHGEAEKARFEVAKALASLEGDILLSHLSALRKGFDEIAADDGFAKQKHDGLTRMGCTLLLAYLVADAAATSSVHDMPVFNVPALDDPEHLDLMVEVLHATLRGWPVRLKLNDARDKLTSASRVFRPSGQAPGSWREEDHLMHLVDRILSARPFTAAQLSCVDDAPLPASGQSALNAPGDQERRQKERAARRLLQSWLDQDLGVVVNALDSSSPYSAESLQTRLSQAFGELIALVLPSPDPATDDTLDKLTDLSIEAQQFLLKAESTRP
ncbi:MAG: hypothetical protein U5L74_00285 [Ideonella sp.]|nr:hypothetical protein [Ideonella sp.]